VLGVLEVLVFLVFSHYKRAREESGSSCLNNGDSVYHAGNITFGGYYASRRGRKGWYQSAGGPKEGPPSL